MDITSSLHQDSIHGVTDLDPKTPHQDPQKTCTRNSPWLQQGCMICSTPNTHICNLDVALNGSNASPTTHIRNLDVALNGRNASPITHIRNLDVALNGSKASLTTPTTADRPQPPINHHILNLTAMFQDAIQENDIFYLTAVNNQNTQVMSSNPDFALYDSSNLRAELKLN